MDAKEARAYLLEILKPGDTVYTVLRYVSRSGLSRDIDVIVIRDGDPWWITGSVAALLGHRRGQRQGLRVSGAGMDMGFDVVYRLSRTLFPEFHCIGEGCPSNDHSNGDRDYTPHLHSDGGYALTQRWI